MSRFDRRARILRTAIFSLFIISGASALLAQELPASAWKTGFTAVQKTVRPFTAATLSGNPVSDSWLRESLALVYCWSPQKDPKATGILNLSKIVKSHPAIKVLILASEPDDIIRPIVPDSSMNRFIIAGARQTLMALGSPGTPCWLFIKSDGTIIAVRNGNFDPSSPNGIQVLDAMLATFNNASASANVADAPTPVASTPVVSTPVLPTPAASTPEIATPEKPATQTGSASIQPAITLNTGLSDASFAKSIEIEVVAELNLARTTPKAYAQLLREYRKLIRGNYLERPGEITIVLNEGAKAVDEAIAFLERQAAVPALSLSRGLTRAAGDHAKDQGQSGATGHTGRDGSTMSQRIERYGTWQRTCGENIAYGPTTARDIVIQLIVDDGVASRGHRTNIFKAEFLTVGISYGPHKQYGSVCVQDFAGGFTEK